MAYQIIQNHCNSIILNQRDLKIFARSLGQIVLTQTYCPHLAAIGQGYSF